MDSYGAHTTLANTNIDDAVARVTAALAAEGFGVLWTIDVKEVMRKKLDIDHRPYRILGACNPNLARKAIEAEPHIGLLLPCNVMVQEVEGGCEVSLIDPNAMMKMAGNDALAGIAADAADRFSRVRTALSE